jgi:uncharacterized protein with von Willebrand factor type A (vWA) domain
MLQSKSNSKILEQAQRRVSVLNTFALDLDLGDGISLAELQTLTESVRLMTEEYNSAAATFEQLGKQLRIKEQTLADVGDRLSLGVAVRRGRRSPEYLSIKAIRRSNRTKKRSGNAAGNSVVNKSEPTETRLMED